MTKYTPLRKGTLLVPSGPVKHLHIVMNDPVYNPETRYEGILVVNISSVNGSNRYDDTCVLDEDSHPFIVRPSYVSYRDATILRVERVIENVSAGEIIEREPCSEEIYQAVLDGFSNSPHVTPKISRFLKKHVL